MDKFLRITAVFFVAITVLSIAIGIAIDRLAINLLDDHDRSNMADLYSAEADGKVISMADWCDRGQPYPIRIKGGIQFVICCDTDGCHEE